MLPVIQIPGCSDRETRILQLRGRGLNYRAISRETGIAPRLVHDLEQAALKKAVRYLEQQSFLQGKP
jgi:DNA-binding CsgD family transcriptional regulator